MKKDLLKIIRARLLEDTTIAAQVGQNIAVKDLPNDRVPKQITLKKTYGRSNSILTATNCNLYITVWVKNKDVDEPYKITATILEAVIDSLNRKGKVTLTDNDLQINQVIKTDAEINYDDEKERWVGTIVFEVVHDE